MDVFSPATLPEFLLLTHHALFFIISCSQAGLTHNNNTGYNMASLRQIRAYFIRTGDNSKQKNIGGWWISHAWCAWGLSHMTVFGNALKRCVLVSSESCIELIMPKQNSDWTSIEVQKIYDYLPLFLRYFNVNWNDNSSIKPTLTSSRNLYYIQHVNTIIIFELS